MICHRLQQRTRLSLHTLHYLLFYALYVKFRYRRGGCYCYQ